MLQNLLEPRSVAIIGASNDPQRIGGRPLRYYKEAGFDGDLFPVNPNRPEVQGIKAYADILAIPTPIDLAILAVPAAKVVPVLKGGASVGVKSAVIFSSGFSELGADGAAMQDEISQIAADNNILVLGPNCLGVVNGHARHTATFGSFLDSGAATAGPVAVISQSGAFGSYLFSKLRTGGVEVGLWVATGNEAGVTISDAVAYAASHKGTRTIVIYAESLRAGGDLLAAIELARRNGKAVAILKVGRTKAGQLAAASHTSALASNDRSASVLFKAAGAQWLSKTEELIDFAYVTSRSYKNIGRRLGIYTVSGGAGILMVDAAHENNLDIAPVPEALQAEILSGNPHAVASNPIDVTAQAFNDPDLLRTSIAAILRSKAFDCLAAFFMGWLESPVMGPPIRKALEQLSMECAPPIALVADVSSETKSWLDSLGYFVFSDPTRAVAALAYLASVGEEVRTFTDGPIPPKQRPLLEPRAYNEIDAKAWIARVGIPVLQDKICKEKSSAVEEGLIHPETQFALKLLSADIAHKSDVGGVRLNVSGADGIGEAWDLMIQQVRNEVPNATIDGAILTPMAEDGVDLIVGVRNEPGFGPVIMIGLGGIFAEIFEDVTFARCPASPSMIKALLMGLKGSPLLCGARGSEPVDLDAASIAISRISAAAAAAKDFVDIEINPLRVGPKQVVALDGLIHPQLERPPYWCWHDFSPGTELGSVQGVLSDEKAQLLETSVPSILFSQVASQASSQTSSQTLPKVSCGLIVAELMRAYTSILPARSDGNIHAGMTLQWGVIPQLGERVTTSLSCVSKEKKAERLWVTFLAKMNNGNGKTIATAELNMVWGS